MLFHFVDKPSKPLNLRVTDIWKDYITITWEEPENDGGCPLTGYVIEQRDAYKVGNRFETNVGANTLMHQVRSILVLESLSILFIPISKLYKILPHFISCSNSRRY